MDRVSVHAISAEELKMSNSTNPPIVDDGPSNQDLIIGGSLAISGNLLISIALNVQKYALMQLTKRGASEEDYTKSRLWWFGIVLMVIGELGNFMAYGFAPATTVAPLGTTTVLANAYIASLYLGEKVRRQDLLGTLIILVGVFLIITFSTSDDNRLDASQLINHLSQWSFIFYIVIEAIIFIVCIYLVKMQTVNHVTIYLLPAAIVASLTIIGAKAVSSMIDLTLSGNNQLYYPIFYFMIVLMVVTGILQIRYVTKAMQLFDSTVVVPTNFVFFTISAILAGIFFYQEFYGLSYLQVTMFLFACGFCFFGVCLISAGRASSEDENTDELDEKPLLHSKIKHETKDLVHSSDFSSHMVQPISNSTTSSSLEPSDEENKSSPVIHFDKSASIRDTDTLFSSPVEEMDGHTLRKVEKVIKETELK